MPAWTKSLTNPFSIGDLVKKNKDSFLGFSKKEESDDQVASDAGKVVRYSRSEEYKAFEKEAWLQFEGCLKKLLEDDLKDSQAHFCRGFLAATSDLLKVSHDAKERIERKNA